VFSLYEDLSPPRCYGTPTGTVLNTQSDTVYEAATMCQLTRHYIAEYFDAHLHAVRISNLVFVKKN
jgi:hypothetical protein